MKKILLSITTCLSLFLFGCDEHIEIDAPISETKAKDRSIYTDSAIGSFRALLKRQHECVSSGTHDCAKKPGSTTTSCADNFCGSTKCKIKILCCHTIDKDLFNSMTGNKTCGFAIFSWDKVNSVFKATDCDKELVRVIREKRADETYWYVISDQPYSDTTIHNGTWKAYYSAPMIEGLLETADHDNIHIYKGGELSPTEHLLPILVDHGNEDQDEYYNLSNDIP